ncbi:nucleotidyltransferase domain-containing protein [Maribellus comscasis]|uniref:Nucleotidyltransferase domain-containing protein n=1 Tax=Maribellus comscasis TaxID=2681766 RepID=A0A6I6JLZ6_9BACT|nr:nucleotidyltransferase domain-containing protein [Maribellus comscasis]QGY42239.1 nucleotidyltransferase domain-containing protein [Maribellus comscasis]
MIQKQFAEKAVEKLKTDPQVLGLAAGGSYITNELDEFSDLDLVLITKEKISGQKEKMLEYASKMGQFIDGFTGEHVGEPRVLICLFDNPLLHVDIKFVTAEEFKERVENPVILWERENTLSQIIKTTEASWPKLDFQWIEDRFWIWVHYITLKIGRGEYFEALDSISYLRMNVISPLLQIKNNQLPKGMRKVEFNFEKADFNNLKKTVPEYEISSIIRSLEKEIELYNELRKKLYPGDVVLKNELQKKVMEYFTKIKTKVQATDEK